MAKADVTLEFDAKLAPFNRKVDRSKQRIMALEKQVGKLTKKLGRTSRAADKTGRAMENTAKGGGTKFAGMLGTLFTKLGPLVGAGGLMAAFAATMRSVNENAAEAATGLVEVESAMRKLLQIKQDLAGFEEGVAAAKKLSIDAGIPFQQALKISAQAGAAGLDEETTAELTRNAIRLGEDSGAVIEALVTLQRNFPAEEISGIFDKVLAASEATKKSLIETASAAARVGPAAVAVGGDLPEALAISGAFIDPEKGEEQVATKIKAISRNLVRQGVTQQGPGLIKGLEQAIADDPEFIKKRRKEDPEFNLALIALETQGDRLKVIQTKIAASEGLVRRKTAIGQRDPTLTELEKIRQDEQRLEADKRDLFGTSEKRKEVAEKRLQFAQTKFIKEAPGILQPFRGLQVVMDDLTKHIIDLVSSIETEIQIRENLARNVGAFSRVLMGSEGFPNPPPPRSNGELDEQKKQTQLMERTAQCLERLERTSAATADNTRNAGGAALHTDQYTIDIAREGELRGVGGGGR